MADPSLAFTISREAAKLIKAGEAVLSSGGVRDLGGRMIEMGVPKASSKILTTFSSSLLSPLTSGLNIASSLGQNVQSALIQKSLNVANMKLDQVTQQLADLQVAMQGLSAINVLSWANTTLSLANVGISIAGFYMTLKKLDKIEEHIKEFYNRYQQDRAGDTLEKFHNVYRNLDDTLFFFQQRVVNPSYDADDFKNREGTIEIHLNEASGFLERMIREIKENRIYLLTGCQILFTLASIYAQAVNEYCCQYYYVHGNKHGNFDKWLAILDIILEDDFIALIKMKFAFSSDLATISPFRKQDAITISKKSIDTQKQRLIAYAKSIELINEEEYIHIGDILNQGVYLELEKMIHVPNHLSLDDYIMKRVITADDAVFEKGESVSVIIPNV